MQGTVEAVSRAHRQRENFSGGIGMPEAVETVEQTQTERCPFTAPGSEARCELDAGHEGNKHKIAMSPWEMMMRQTVGGLIAHRDQTMERSPLWHSTEAKLNLVLDNQAAILNGLALVLDFDLRSQGLYPAVMPPAPAPDPAGKA
jgi:hypothetical protein